MRYSPQLSMRRNTTARDCINTLAFHNAFHITTLLNAEVRTFMTVTKRISCLFQTEPIPNHESTLSQPSSLNLQPRRMATTAKET